MLKIIRTVSAMAAYSSSLKKSGKTIGFVPTMGYLHEGHVMLVRASKVECDKTIVSIFVNPTQFGPKEDLKKYPRDLKRDIAILSKEKVDVVFCPSEKEMYPKGYVTFVDVKEIGNRLCGKSRPGHFRGVATIVSKLFNIVAPDHAYFGQKDFQQQSVIKQMVKDLNFTVKVIVVPTVREKNGLAMSSRNKFLSLKERANAVALYDSLVFAKELIASGIKSADTIRKAMKRLILTHKGASIDYILVSDPDTFKEKKLVKGETLIALAVFFGRTRLIDNMLVRGKY